MPDKSDQPQDYQGKKKNECMMLFGNFLLPEWEVKDNAIYLFLSASFRVHLGCSNCVIL